MTAMLPVPNVTYIIRAASFGVRFGIETGNFEIHRPGRSNNCIGCKALSHV